MKKLTILFAALTIVLTLQAESPQKINYQAIIRNTKGVLVTNTTIEMQISIYFYVSKTTTKNVYVETHTPVTNENGLVSIEIGTGNVVTGVFADIDWAARLFYLKTEIDPGGRTGYTITSDTQIMSVPYAMHAKTATNAVTSETATLATSATVATTALSAASVSISGRDIVFDYCADADNNIYRTVKIGTQVWMTENLRTTKYRNGETIPKVTANATWDGLTTGAWSNYNNQDVNGIRFGHLYNWFAIADSRNIAPEGWHVATDAEWTTLENYLIANGGNWDGTTTGDKIAKSIASVNLWESSSTAGIMGNEATLNDLTGFSALPGGYRLFGGNFMGKGSNCKWWTSTENNTTLAWDRYLGIDAGGGLGRGTSNKNAGQYVRCVKD